MLEDMIGDLTGLMAVCLIFGGPIFWIWTRHQRHIIELKGLKSSDLALVMARLDRMEQRLQSLERLATDPATRLSEDIERLRGSAN